MSTEGTPRILIVEDNERNRKLFRLIVESLGFETALANDGEQGLRMVEEVQPDLILMDIQMPRMDGMAMLERLRREVRTRTIPAIAITSFAMPGDRERLLAAGFVDYLSKPVDTEALQQAIRRQLRAGRERAQ
ncbi:MAG: response regulator [Gammaproteobacteria bacterium]|nr:response regulator [Gammaproteobacteria bacterium]